MSKKTIVILSVIVSVFLVLTSIGLWLERQIFNEERFKNTAVGVIKTDQVREAIADEIIIIVTGDFPELQNLATEFVEPTLAELLNSDFVSSAVEEVAGEIQVALTSSEPQAVAIDISGITGPLKTAAGFIPNLNSDVENAIKDLPASIELIEKGGIPSIFTIGLILMWIGRLTGVTALVIFGVMVWKAIAKRQSQILRTLGIYISIGAAIFLVLIWAISSPLLATIGSGNIRVIVTNIFEAFLRILVNQTWVILVGGLVLIGASYLLGYWREDAEIDTKMDKEEFEEAA